MIGGVVARQPADAPLTEAALRSMAGRFPASVAPALVVRGALGLLAVEPAGRLEAAVPVAVAAEADLTNRDELRRLTGVDGNDLALIRALYAEHGGDFATRLRGAFAVAVWDPREATLLIAVDRFNARRLYYAAGPRLLAFASHPGLLRAVPGVDGRIDHTAVYTYLNLGYVPAPGSIFTGITRLPAAHWLALQSDRLAIRPYWELGYTERPLGRRPAATAMYRLTEKAVTESLGGAAPAKVGAFLSGGTDSSTVLGLMSRSVGSEVQAFSIGFQEDRYNELRYAELSARHFGAKHHTRIVTADDALALVPRLVEAFAEPFGNNSAIGTAACASLARDLGVERMLAGDGGDEIFGGNERYRTDRIFASYHRLPRPLRRGVLEPVLLGLPDGGETVLGRAQRYIRRANIPNPERFYSYEFFFAREGHDLLAPEFRQSVDLRAPHAVLSTHYAAARATCELNRLLYLDLQLTIGDNDLLKVVRTADLAGVQVRFPLLDPNLVEFTGALPARFKVRGFEKRYLFKQAFQHLLPRETLAKRKQGFGVPTSMWLRSHRGFRELAADTLLSARAHQRGYFRPGAVEELFRRHATDVTPFHGDQLWRLLMLELWHRTHAAGGVPA